MKAQAKPSDGLAQDWGKPVENANGRSSLGERKDATCDSQRCTELRGALQRWWLPRAASLFDTLGDGED
jgi:hypothetical protein